MTTRPAALGPSIAACLAMFFATVQVPAGFAQVQSTEQVPPSPASPPDQRSAPTTDPAAAGYALGDLVRLAEENNPLLRRDFARIEEARGLALQAGLYPNPRLDSTNPQQIAGASSQYSTGLLQEVVTKGKLQLDQAAATEALRQAQLGYDLDRHVLLRDVRKQFYIVLAAQERREALEQTKRIVDSAAQTAVKMRQGGERGKTGELLLGIEADRVGVALQNAVTLEATGKRQLAAYVGLADLPIPRVLGDLYLRPPHYDADTVREAILSQNAQIQIAQVDIARRQFLLRRAQVEPYPNIDVGAGYQYSVEPVHNQALLYIAFPLPLWNRNQGGIAAAAAGVRDSVETVGVVQNALLQQAADAMGRLETSRQLAEQFRQHIFPKAQEALGLVRRAYESGNLDLALFLNAQRTLIDARVGLIDALDSQWSAAADLAMLMQLDSFP